MQRCTLNICYTPPTSNAPLRGGKGTHYEGGIRVLILVSLPGVIPAGKTSNAIVRAEDFYPTILDMLGVPKPAQQTFDGSSFAAVLYDPSAERDVPVFFPAQFGVAVRSGDWKLLVNYRTRTRELYNLRDDISEANDLATKHPERVGELFTLIEDHFAATGCTINPNLWNAVKPEY